MNGVPSELALRWVEFPFTDPGIICRECCACGRQHGDRDDQQITMTHEIFSCPAVFSGEGGDRRLHPSAGSGRKGLRTCARTLQEDALSIKRMATIFRMQTRETATARSQ